MIKGRLKTSKTRFQTTFDLSGYTISQYGSSSAVGIQPETFAKFPKIP